MKNRNTFQANSTSVWDFTTIWRIPSGTGYPIHQWVESFASPSVASLFNGGAGTPGDPWQIDTAQQLKDVIYAMNLDSGVYNDSFILTSDIDLSGFVNLNIGSTTASREFAGSFDGGNHTISNVTISSPLSYVGLFGKTSGATISNLNITVTAVSGVNYVGALIGHAFNTNISNVSVTGISANKASTVSGTSSVGGMIGYLQRSAGTMLMTQATVSNLTVSSSSDILGGVIGYVLGALTVSDSTADNITVSGPSRQNVGGFVGSMSGATINRCGVDLNSVVSAGTNVGGFVGNMVSGSTVSSSYSLANVTGTVNYIGGFVGTLDGTGVTSAITNSYSQGSVNASNPTQGNNLGGFVGNKVSSNISYIYATGSVCGGSCTGANDGPLLGSSNSAIEIRWVR
jgi:hypothetical protein